MRLCEIKGERTLDVIAEILDPIDEIASDPEAAEVFLNKRLPEGEDPAAYARRRIKKAVPRLLKHHKDAVISIIAAVNGVERAEYIAGMTVPRFVLDGTEMLTDPVFRQFFISAQTGEVASSGAAPEATERDQ